MRKSTHTPTQTQTQFGYFFFLLLFSVYLATDLVFFLHRYVVVVLFFSLCSFSLSFFNLLCKFVDETYCFLHGSLQLTLILHSSIIRTQWHHRVYLIQIWRQTSPIQFNRLFIGWLTGWLVHSIVCALFYPFIPINLGNLYPSLFCHCFPKFQHNYVARLEYNLTT